jgi:hypothetical protein
VHLFDFKTTGCSGCLKFSERFKPVLCTYLILKTTGCSSCIKFSESKNRWFQFFEGEKKNRIRESFILDISETLQNQQFSWKNCQRTGG